ncbi:hypothetical protein CANMA_002757 [Candida margitis]|uniref:uncharacterized protein n=1 Tax=Candida margitis TaxID=1775924 RepID=UPI002227019B|nr:uncharacterized protein CANMA_002757 [Candida margitis]KAI5967989.1 hypothetical protein CANMA_002757 [Candida margitis]
MLPYRSCINSSRVVNQLRRPSVRFATQVGIFTRLQSTQAATTKEPLATSGNLKPSTKPQKNVNKTGAPKIKKLNHKVSDISQQIKKTLESSTDLKEAKDIFEEGISFLREVQHEEYISDRDLYSAFLPLATGLLTKAKKAGADLEEHLSLFVKYRVAHQYHFTEVAANLLKNEDGKFASYQKIIHLWVTFIEYDKLNFIPNVFVETGESRIRYNKYQLPHIVYYAYVLSCLLQNVPYSEKDALRFFETGKVPFYNEVKSTLFNYGVFNRLEFEKFRELLEDDRKSKVDPNSVLMLTRINRATDRKLLDVIYTEIAEICEKRDLKIEERIMVQLMEKYLYYDEYDQVFSMFQNIMKSGISPSIDAWNLVLKAMINPNRFNNASEAQKEELMQKFERTLKTILASGLKYNVNTLSSIISAYSIADKFDIAEDYAKQYAGLGINDAAKDGILRGLIFNGKIVEAESRMEEYIKDGGNYKPNVGVMNDFLNYYFRKQNYNAIFGINDFMKQHGIEENVVTLTTMINAYFKYLVSIGKSPNLGDFLQTLKGAKSLNEHTFASVLNGLIQSANIDAARQLYNVLKRKFPRSAWIQSNMLTGELTLGDVSAAEQIFIHYITKIRNDPIIWNTMLRNVLLRDENKALEYFGKMKKAGDIKPNEYTYYFLLDYFYKKGNKDVVQKLLNDLASSSLTSYGTKLPNVLLQIHKRVVPLSAPILVQMKKNL